MIIQTAHPSPGLAWLEYHLAFCKDATATDSAGATVSASRIASPGTMVNTSGPLGNDDDDDRLYLRANAQLNQTKSNFFGKA